MPGSADDRPGGSTGPVEWLDADGPLGGEPDELTAGPPDGPRRSRIGWLLAAAALAVSAVVGVVVSSGGGHHTPQSAPTVSVPPSRAPSSGAPASAVSSPAPGPSAGWPPTIAVDPHSGRIELPPVSPCDQIAGGGLTCTVSHRAPTALLAALHARFPAARIRSFATETGFRPGAAVERRVLATAGTTTLRIRVFSTLVGNEQATPLNSYWLDHSQVVWSPRYRPAQTVIVSARRADDGVIPAGRVIRLAQDPRLLVRPAYTATSPGVVARAVHAADAGPGRMAHHDR